MFVVVISIFKGVYVSLSIEWNPGLIPRIFNSSVDYVKACIISLSRLFFIDVVSMALQ